MGLAELQVAVPEPRRRDGAQLGSKSAARSRICQLSLWAGKALVARGSPVTVSHRAGVWCSRVIDSQKLGFTGEKTDQETRKWKYKYHCQPLDTISLSPFLKKANEKCVSPVLGSWRWREGGPWLPASWIFVRNAVASVDVRAQCLASFSWSDGILCSGVWVPLEGLEPDCDMPPEAPAPSLGGSWGNVGWSVAAHLENKQNLILSWQHLFPICCAYSSDIDLKGCHVGSWMVSPHGCYFDSNVPEKISDIWGVTGHLMRYRVVGCSRIWESCLGWKRLRWPFFPPSLGACIKTRGWISAVVAVPCWLICSAALKQSGSWEKRQKAH